MDTDGVVVGEAVVSETWAIDGALDTDGDDTTVVASGFGVVSFVDFGGDNRTTASFASFWFSRLELVSSSETGIFDSRSLMLALLPIEICFVSIEVFEAAGFVPSPTVSLISAGVKVAALGVGVAEGGVGVSVVLEDVSSSEPPPASGADPEALGEA